MKGCEGVDLLKSKVSSRVSNKKVPKQKWKVEVKKKRATAESGFIPYPVVALFKRR